MNTFIIFFGIGFLVATIVVLMIALATGKKLTVVPIFAAISLALIILGNSFVIVPTGKTGVRTTFGQVDNVVVSKGFHWKKPFVEKVALINNKQQDIAIDTKIWGETKEKTPVFATDVVITYQINENASAWLYSNVTDIRNLLDDKIVASALKNAMVELNVETVTNRSYIEPLSVDKLQMAVNEKYGENVIIIKHVVINNMDFEESYNQAIAEKSIASQNRQKQSIENETAVAKAEADKKVAIAKAQGEAESKRITAEADAQAALTRAEAEAEANRKLNESLSENVLQNKAINKWDGSLPFVNGDSTTPIINIPVG